MLKFFPYVLKTLLGHRVRTLLTICGSALALLVFCVFASVHQGLHDLSQRNERTLVAFQENKFCPATSHLPQDYAHEIARMPGVRDVTPIQVFTNNCRASLDIVVFYGVPPRSVRETRDFRLLAGSWGEFEEHQDAALVGRAVADRRDINVRDRFSIGGLTVTVAGIFAADDLAEEQYIYSHLEFIQRRSGQDSVGTVTQLEVRLAPDADPQAVCEQIDERFRGAQVATYTRPKGVFQAASLADLFELIELTQYLGYACLGLMAVLVSTTTLMAVQDRTQEHAVLQTLGFSGPRVFGLVLGESLLQSVIGGGIGVAVALGTLAWTGLSVGAEAVTVPFAPSAELAVTGLVLSFGIGVMAGVVPAWQAARAEIVTALRAGG